MPCLPSIFPIRAPARPRPCSSSLALCAVAFNIVWWSGIRGRRLLGAGIDEAGVRTITGRYRLGPPGYALATAVAAASVWLSLAIHVALALLFSRSEKDRHPRG